MRVDESYDTHVVFYQMTTIIDNMVKSLSYEVNKKDRMKQPFKMTPNNEEEHEIIVVLSVYSTNIIEVLNDIRDKLPDVKITNIYIKEDE